MSDIYAAELNPTKPVAVAARLSTRFNTTIAAEDVRMIAAFRFDDPAGDVGCETHIVAVSLPDRGDVVLQVPFTYRGAPLEDVPPTALVTTMDHSVLGDRWVYDAAHDPVYVTELLLAITDGRSAAEQFRIAADGSRTLITEGLASVRGTGPVPDLAAGTNRTDSAVVAGGTIAGSVGKSVAPDGAVLSGVDFEGDSTVLRLSGTAVELVDVLDIGASKQLADAAGSAPVSSAENAGELVATWAGQDSPVTLARIIR